MFNNENDFKKLVDRLNVDAEPNPEHRQKLRSQMLSTFTGQQRLEAQTSRRFIMKAPIPKLGAAAAVIVVAVLIGIHQFGGLTHRKSVAFADVVRPLLTARSVTYKKFIVSKQGEGPIVQDMVLGSRVRRIVPGVEGASIIDLQTKRALTLNPKDKSALYVDLKSFSSMPPDYLDVLRNIITELQQNPEFVVEKLGERQIGAYTAIGFHAVHPRVELTIWADAKTAYPIRIEQKDDQVLTVSTDFQFDVEMDESLFAMEVPEGYTVQQTELDITASTEQDFIDGLRLWAQVLLNGVFPKSMDIADMQNQATMVQEKLAQLQLSDQEKLQLGMKLTRTFLFIRFFKGEGDWHYAGEGVRLGDADTPIFWYRPPASQTYRVIYGDLSVTDTARENLPKQMAETTHLVALDIKLPKPMFEGTPQDTRVPNLENPTGKPRPPFYAPEGTKNVAYEKPVSSTDEEPIIGELEMITDGDKEAADGSYVLLGPFKQSVTIDLQAEYNIYAIVLWHFHKQARVYFDVVVQVAGDPDFIDARTLFNNDIDNSAGFGVGKDMHYTETNEGKLIDAKGVKARYVRLTSNGNNNNDLNDYIEVEVYAKPVE